MAYKAQYYPGCTEIKKLKVEQENKKTHVDKLPKKYRNGWK